MTTQLYYFPGQKATIFLETLDSNLQRADGYLPYDGYMTPVITRVVFPDLSLAAGFPQSMVKLDTGLYYFQFTLPVGATAVGSYLVDVTYNGPGTSNFYTKIYQLIVNAPFGNYSYAVTVGN